jgi:hypothetical protein
MGIAANNERIKLRATFYNNLSVTLFLAMVVIPVFSLFFRSYEFGLWFYSWREGRVSVGFEVFAPAAGWLISLGFGLMFRRWADEEISKMEE